MNRHRIQGILLAAALKTGQQNILFFPLALLTTRGRLTRNSRLYVGIFCLLSTYLILHASIGSIDAKATIINIARLTLPFLTASLVFSSIASSKDPRKNMQKLADGLLIVCALDLIPGYLLNPAEVLRAIITGDIYFIKDKNLFLQNTNYTAFFCYTAAAIHIATINTSSRTITRGRLLLAGALILLTYSKMYVACFAFLITTNRLLKANNKYAAVAFQALTIAAIAGSFVFLDIGSIDYSTIRDRYGSTATKFEIFAYTHSFINNADLSKLLLGLGPQVVAEEYVLTYTGHSLIGNIPELGLFSACYLLPFYWLYTTNKQKFATNTLFLLAAIFVTYPISYITPFLIYIQYLNYTSDRLNKFDDEKRNRSFDVMHPLR